MSNSAKRLMESKARAAAKHQFECQCCSPKRTLTEISAQSHHRAAQQRRDQANAYLARRGKELLEATVPRPVPILQTARLPMAIAAKGRARPV